VKNEAGAAEERAEAAIVGAGPIGIELAVALKRAGISTLHFDKGQMGQTITTFPKLMNPEDRVKLTGSVKRRGRSRAS